MVHNGKEVLSLSVVDLEVRVSLPSLDLSSPFPAPSNINFKDFAFGVDWVGLAVSTRVFG